MTFASIEAISTPDQASLFPVQELDNKIFNGIEAVEAELSLLPNHPDMADGQIYAFGTPEQKSREQDDSANEFLMAAVDATMGGMSAMPAQFTQAYTAASNAIQVTSDLSQKSGPSSSSSRATFKRKSDNKPESTSAQQFKQALKKQSTKSRGGKVATKSSRELLAEKKREQQMAAFNKTKSKRMGLEKRAAELYRMRATVQKYKMQGITNVKVDMDSQYIKPITTGASPSFRPEMVRRTPTPQMGMSAPRPSFM